MLLLLTTAFAPVCFTEEYVGSHIIKDTRWNADDSPYIIEHDLIIDKNVCLTISPGTIVLIKKLKLYDSTLQYDASDSQLISIKVKGSLSCVGKPDRHVIFTAFSPKNNSYGWYGIVFDNATKGPNEIAFCDIANAYRGVSIKQCAPLLRNLTIEYNHIGIYCSTGGNASIYNCILSHNFASAIHFREANPQIANCIIAFNKNNGIIGDGTSEMNFEYNCVYSNDDGNFMDCNPELGVLIKASQKTNLQTDFAHNIYTDPIFAGSPSDSQAEKKDITLPTPKTQIRDTAIANAYYSNTTTGVPVDTAHKREYKKYELSSYSPCKDHGIPKATYNDIDQSRNDMGIWGGPELLIEKKDSFIKLPVKKH
jgi:hypothetical protein